MATTQAGAALAEQHRQQQLAVRAQALRDYLALWPIWRGDDDSFMQMATASYALVRLYRSISSSVAASFYTSFRFAEGASGTMTPVRAPEVDRRRVVGTMYLLGPAKARARVPSLGAPLVEERDPVLDELDALLSATEAAMDAAFVETSGAVSTFVLEGGRETIVESVKADPAAVGWARVTDSDPCAFCRLLASRGAVYKEDTVGFQAHRLCGCGAVPVFHRDDPLPQSRRWLDEYNAAIRAARAAGDLRRDSGRGYLIRAYRRYLSGAYAEQ